MAESKKNPVEMRKWGGWYGDKIGVFIGRYRGLEGTEAIIERSDGSLRRVELWHLCPPELAYIQTLIAEFPEAVVPCPTHQEKTLLVDLSAENLPAAPLHSWLNPGANGGSFQKMNQPLVVEKIEGRQGVRMDRRFAFFDMDHQVYGVNAVYLQLFIEIGVQGND